MKSFDDYLTPKRIIVFMLLLAFIVISIAPLIRFFLDKPIIAFEQPYYDLRISQKILESGFFFNDNLVVDGRDYIAKPYHAFLALLLYFLEPKYLAIMPLIFGLTSILLIYVILRKLKLNLSKTFFILLALTLSPAFIYAFGTFNDSCVSIFLLLLGIYLFLKIEKLLLAPLFVFLIALLFNLNNIFVIIFITLFLSQIYPEKKKNSYIIITLTLIVAFLYYTPLYFNNTISSRLEIFGVNSFRSFIADLGGQIGIGIFTLILGFIGLFIYWKEKDKLKNVHILTLLFVLVGLYFSYVNIYLNFIFCAFAGLATDFIIRRKWDIDYLKIFMVLLLLSGILFSTISYTDTLISSAPDRDIKKSLEWLESNSNPNDVIFSHYSNGLWIEYWADRPVVADSLFNYKNAKQKIYDSNLIFYSRNLENTKNLLDKYNIRYIFVDKSMKNGVVWTKEEDLLYLFRNNDTFKKVYEKRGIEIVEYLLAKK